MSSVSARADRDFLVSTGVLSSGFMTTLNQYHSHPLSCLPLHPPLTGDLSRTISPVLSLLHILTLTTHPLILLLQSQCLSLYRPHILTPFKTRIFLSSPNYP